MENQLLVCGKDDVITMMEAEGTTISEEAVVTVSTQALSHIKTLQEFQESIIREVGKEKVAVTPPQLSTKRFGSLSRQFGRVAQRTLFSRIKRCQRFASRGLTNLMNPLH